MVLTVELLSAIIKLFKKKIKYAIIFIIFTKICNNL